MGRNGQVRALIRLQSLCELFICLTVILVLFMGTRILPLSTSTRGAPPALHHISPSSEAFTKNSGVHWTLAQELSGSCGINMAFRME